MKEVMYVADPSQDGIPTAPIEIPAEFMARARRTFRLLEPAELTEKEFRFVQLQMTAYYHAQKLLTQTTRIEPPEAYSERFYIWQMLFKQLIPLGGLLLVIVVVTLVFSGGAVNGWALFFWILGLLVVILIYVWVAYRMFYEWKHTLLFCTVQATGIRRKSNRWLLINGDNSPEVSTVDIQTKNISRSNFASFFKFNSWRVTLDTPSEKDEFLRNRFVRDGDRLKKTINAMQQYLSNPER